MARTLVTGAGGFIGSHLVEALLARGDEVTATDIEESIPQRLSHLSHHENFRYIAADARDKNGLELTIPEHCQEIFHLAAIVGVRNYCDDPLKTIDVNIGGLRNILELALARNCRLIYTSTSEIYGKNPNIPWHEDSDRVLGPTSTDRWSYSSSKAVCEHMLFGVHKKHNLPTSIVRFFNVYGPRQSPIFVVPAMIKEVLNDRNPLVYDAGQQTRCFTFIDDIMEGLLKVSKNASAQGQAFNLGNTKETRMVDLAKMIIDLAGKSGQCTPEFVDPRETHGSYEDIDRRIPDVSKAKLVLDWEAKTSLDVGLRKTIEFMRSNV